MSFPLARIRINAIKNSEGPLYYCILTCKLIHVNVFTNTWLSTTNAVKQMASLEFSH